MISNQNKSKAFTLIELLVVIAIIGILSSVVLAALSGARESARDTKRLQDIRQINTAIQMYMNDNGGNPPLEGNDTWYDSRNWRTGGDSAFSSELKSYLDPAPIDPVNEFPLNYYYRAGGNPASQYCNFTESEDNYVFLFAVEGELSNSKYNHFSTPDGYNRYCITY